MTKPKVLFLAHLLPWPLEGGGQIKSYHVLKLLSQEYDVTMVALIRSEAERDNIEPLSEFCVGGIHLVTLPRGKARDLGIAARTMLMGASFLISRDEVPEMHAQVESLIERERFAAIHVDHLQMASYVPQETHGAKVVLDQHNVEHRIPKRIAETPTGIGGLPMRAFAGLEWRRMRVFERSALDRSDLTLAVSEEDRQSLQGLLGEKTGKIVTVPIGVDTAFFGEVRWKPGGTSLVSIGTMYWPPNVDAMLYFYGEIFPRIRQQRSDVTLSIVGARPTREIQALADDPKVIVTGLVPDTRPYAETCGVFVVPLRSGSGMRVKILNAMAMGVPIVSTTVGAEGIEVVDGENILLADSPEAFADATLRVLSDTALASRIALAGQETARRAYSWDAVGARLLAAYREALA